MKHDHRRLHGKRGQARRPLAGQGDRACSSLETDALFALETALANDRPHAGDGRLSRRRVLPTCGFVMPDQLLELGSAKASRRTDEVDRFEHAGLALTVVTRQDGESGQISEVGALDVAKMPKRYRCDCEGVDHRRDLALLLQSWHRQITISRFGADPIQRTARPSEFTHARETGRDAWPASLRSGEKSACSVRLSGLLRLR